MDRICTRCVLDLPRGSRDELCASCRLFVDGFSLQELQEEVSHFVLGARRGSAVLVEFSGGRHSTIALALARRRLGLNVVAVTLDNGFLPARVLRQARELADRLGARHLVVEASLGIGEATAAQRPSMAECCAACNRHLSSAVLQICRGLGLRQVANGENKYRTLRPRVTARGEIAARDGFRVTTLNLPFALRVTRAEGDEVLREIGWRETGVPGHSSNCLVPWLSQEAGEALRVGNPLVAMIAAEVRSGHLSRQEGFVALGSLRPASPSEARAAMARQAAWIASRGTPRVVADSASGVAG